MQMPTAITLSGRTSVRVLSDLLQLETEKHVRVRKQLRICKNPSTFPEFSGL